MGSSPDSTWHDLIRGDAEMAWDALDRMGLTLARVHEKTRATDFRERFNRAANSLIFILDGELYPLTEEGDPDGRS